MSRAERARDTLDASLRAAGIHGFSSEATPFDRVIVRFDSATDAYLAATRLAYLRAWKESAEDRELVVEATDPADAPQAEVAERILNARIRDEAVSRVPSIQDWAQAHQAFRAKYGRTAHPDTDHRTLREELPEPARSFVLNLPVRRPPGGEAWAPPAEETGRKGGW